MIKVSPLLFGSLYVTGWVIRCRPTVVSTVFSDPERWLGGPRKTTGLGTTEREGIVPKEVSLVGRSVS